MDYKPFDELATMEPKLLQVEQACIAAGKKGDCWNRVWDEIAKPMMRPLVGVYRRPLDELSTSWAWDTVAVQLQKDFPLCLKRCASCGLPVPAEETFTGKSTGSAGSVLGTFRGTYTSGLKNSWVVVVDMLGFSRGVQEAASAGRATEHLAKIKAILENAYGFLKPGEYAGKPSWALKLYSDNAVLGSEIYDDGESESANVFDQLCTFQLASIFNGQFVRGGISVGGAYINEDLAYGQALIDAHDMEKASNVPRIIFSPQGRRVIAHYSSYYGGGGIAALKTFFPILEDGDGQWFLDYLGYITGDRAYTRLDEKALARHRTIVGNALERFASDPKIDAKYRWVAGYHNWACRKIGKPNLQISGTHGAFPEPKGYISKAALTTASDELRARRVGTKRLDPSEVVDAANRNAPNEPRP